MDNTMVRKILNNGVLSLGSNPLSTSLIPLSVNTGGGVSLLGYGVGVRCDFLG